jgi:hypothetical protein
MSVESFKATCVLSTIVGDEDHLGITCKRADSLSNGPSGASDISGNMASVMHSTISNCVFAPGPSNGQLMMFCENPVQFDLSNNTADVSGNSHTADVSGNQTYNPFADAK